MTREELVNSREYKIASAALNDISNIDEEYAVVLHPCLL